MTIILALRSGVIAVTMVCDKYEAVGLFSAIAGG